MYCINHEAEANVFNQNNFLMGRNLSYSRAENIFPLRLANFLLFELNSNSVPKFITAQQNFAGTPLKVKNNLMPCSMQLSAHAWFSKYLI